jgi:hypothetical protein
LDLLPSRPPAELLGTVTCSSPLFGEFNCAEKANKANRDPRKVGQYLYHWASAAKYWGVLPPSMEAVMAQLPTRSSAARPTNGGAPAARLGGTGTGTGLTTGPPAHRAQRASATEAGAVESSAKAARAGTAEVAEEYDDESDDEALLLFDPSALDNHPGGRPTVSTPAARLEAWADAEEGGGSDESDEAPGGTNEARTVKVGTAAELAAATAEWDRQQSDAKPWEALGPLLRDSAMEAAKQRTPRIIAIGDVHGCIDELQLLLKKCDYQPGDAVVFLGDLVAKGPDSCAVVQMVTPCACACLQQP